MQRHWGRSDFGIFENTNQVSVARRWRTRGRVVGDEGEERWLAEPAGCPKT